MKIPFLEIKFTTEFELIEKLLRIYDISKPTVVDKSGKEVKLRKFQMDVLKYYMRYGYSKETKNIVEKDTGKTLNNIVQIDYHLKEAGYLIDMENNFRMKKLNPQLELIRASFIEKKNRVYGIAFKNG
jgi:hypothetical protein